MSRYWWLLVVKLVVYVAELICSSVAFYFARQDLAEYTKSNASNLTVWYVVENKHVNATVNVTTFKTFFNPYTLFFALQIGVPILYFLLYFSKFKEDEKSKYLWLPIAIVIEMPLVFLNATFLVARGAVSSDIDEQLFDLLLQTVFVLQLPIQFSLDFILWKRSFNIMLLPFLLGFAFIATTVIYYPVSVRIVGFKGFEAITIEDFPGIILDSNAEKIMLILNNVGHIGQFLSVAFIIAAFLYCCYKARKDPEIANAQNEFVLGVVRAATS